MAYIIGAVTDINGMIDMGGESKTRHRVRGIETI